MNRFLVATALVSLMFGLSGCGGNAVDESSDSAVPETRTELKEQEPVFEENGSAPEEESRASEEKPATAQEVPDAAREASDATQEIPGAARLALLVNGEPLDAAWQDNESVAALQELAKNKPLEIQMSMYGGFEQVGPLGADLPRNDEQTTTQAGDIVLYQGNQIVVFYGSNSWSYTRLGRIEGKTAEELVQLLGQQDATLTLEVR